MKKINKNAFISMVAERSRFSKGDIRIIVDTIIEVFEDVVRNQWEFNVKGLGSFRFTKFVGGKRRIPVRGMKGAGAGVIAPTRTGIRTIFSLSENIRDSAKED